MSNTPKKIRQYKYITPQTIANVTAMEIEAGNTTEAVRQLEDTRLSPKSRAFRIRAKRNQTNAADYIENTMQQIGIDAINRVGNMVNSADERVATKNAHFVIEHIRGKAVQKTEGKHLNINIEAVLD